MALTPEKTYAISRSWATGRHLEIKHGIETVLWVNSTFTLFGQSYIYIYKNGHRGELVAAVKPESNEGSFTVCLGAPSDRTNYAERPVNDCGDGVLDLQFQISLNNGKYVWHRTRYQEVSVQSSGGKIETSSRDWKLIFSSNEANGGLEEKIVALYVQDANRKTRIYWFEDPGRKRELWCLAMIMGIVQRGKGRKKAHGFGSASSALSEGPGMI